MPKKQQQQQTATSQPFTVQVQPAPALSASFQVTAAQAGTNLPFTIGHAFKKGEIPAGSIVVGNIPELQVVAKNAWPDGSMKFALVSGLTSFAAAGAKMIGLSIGQATTAPTLTTADLRATGISASIGAGGFGSASWSDTDWDTPFMEWVRGPFMSSWIYRKQIGSDAHLVGWLEVRLYKGGGVEVLPWIENGYLTVAAPTSKNATYTFALGGTQRFSATFDLLNHNRTVLVSGSALSHWLGADPKLTPTHDKAYLQATRLVPAYRAQLTSTSAIWSSLAQSYTPLQQGNYPSAMGATGYDGSIGLLPEWDVAYLVSNDIRAYAGVVINGYSAGRYGIHFRDERTMRPLRFSSYPNLVVESSSGVGATGASSKNTYTPAATGTQPPIWASTHHPSVGFMAYLLTGRFYFMEEVQFAATLHFLKNTDTQRQFTAGVLQSSVGANITRGAAWATRTLAQAACITPDADTALRTEFLSSLEANVNFYHGRYVAIPNNPLGFVQPYSDYTTNGDGKYFEATWMQDFFTAAYGYAIDMDLAISATGKTRIKEFFAWKARSIVGRLGGTAPTDYLYCDAAPYTIAIAPTDTPDYTNGTGPWFADWGQAYAATMGAPNSGVAGDLRGGNFPAATSYWGNLQPAIAYAVEHNIPGALDAYKRMTSAGNWPTLANNMNAAPVWSVRPRNA
ncbi:hypothetical protein [Noviherbaspirillum sp. ST9]|uniref:hypothetical protein n=1 Tax=Noviherbaspirillum sp. ST9 TaxID=3401606 RepID=UPI003B587136